LRAERARHDAPDSEIAVLGGDAAAAAWSLHMPVHAQKLLVDRAAPRRLFQAAEL
jgi:hypothetical protein